VFALIFKHQKKTLILQRIAFPISGSTILKGSEKQIGQKIAKLDPKSRRQE